MIFTIDAHKDELRDQHEAWFAASQRERIAEALLDENGLRPTEAELDVIMTVVYSCDYDDQQWADHDYPGSPDVVFYASHAESGLASLRMQR